MNDWMKLPSGKMVRPPITKGPWRWAGTKGKPHIKAYLFGDPEVVLADCTGLDVSDANAQVIAALPTILEVLEMSYRLACASLYDASDGGIIREQGYSMEWDAAVIEYNAIRGAMITAGYTEEEPT